MKNLDPQLLWAFGGVLGLLAVSSLIGLALKLVSDLTYMFIDPRIDFGTRGG